MKIIKFMIPLLALTGCSKNNMISQTEVSEELSYTLIEDKTIEWDQIFDVELDDYYTYIYSPTCGHCNEIKNTVINYGLNHDDFFFVLYNKDIPVITEKDSIIGNTSIEEIGVVGTPSLFHILNGVLIENIVGSNAIIETLTNDV